MSGPVITALVGNPKPGSRTLGVAETIAVRIAGDLDAADVAIVDIAADIPRLLDPLDAATTGARERLLRSDLLIVASPTFKGAYTGVLKVLLDQLPPESLAERLAVPVMTGAAPFHSLAPEVHLRPVLLELGATCPTRGLYVLESQLPELDAVVSGWWASAAWSVLPLLARSDRLAATQRS